MELTSQLYKHKSEAERLFCASLLLGVPDVQQSCGWLSSKSFGREEYGKFWQFILDGSDAVKAAVEAGVYSELVDAQLDLVNPLGYRGFAETISQDGKYLDMAAALPELAKALSERNDAQITKLARDIADMHAAGPDAIPHAVDIAGEFADYVDNPGEPVTIGIPKIDAETGGLERGSLTLIAARPSVGKSSFVFQVARNIAAKRQRALYFSLEMKRLQLWSRAACGVSGVDWRKVRAGKLDDNEKQRLADANTQLMNRLEDRLYIDDTSRITTEVIWRRCAQYKPDLVVIDHMGLVGDDDNRWSEVKRLGAIAWAGKRLAKELDCVVLYVNQLNRSVELRAEKKPTLSDLRDSGELEQTADNVLFLYREDYHAGTQVEVSDTEVLLAKVRNGSRNMSTHLNYDLRRQWFYDPSQPAERNVRY